MDPRQQPSLAPGERLNKYGQVYNFEEWKASKIADGTWIENMDEWKQRKQDGSLPAAGAAAPYFPPSLPPYAAASYTPQPTPPYAASMGYGAPAPPLELVPLPPPPAPVPQEVQFPPRVLPPSSQMGEGMLEERPRFNILPPPAPIPRLAPPPGPVLLPLPPVPWSDPLTASSTRPVSTTNRGTSGKSKKKKPEEWIPLKDFMENRKRKNDEYVEREQKVLKMSEQYESSDDMSRRVVIFDTETTGLGAEHEIVEIAMIETIEGIKTGRYLHFFINPDGENTKKAYEIHRLTKESLSSHPKFWQVARKIATFIGSSSLMAHNASFDMGMLNRGMIKAGLNPYPPERFICTKKMSKALFPSERASQDYLCHKFGVDNFNRETTGIHSAIEDTTQLYHIFRGMIPLLEKKNLCWSMFRLS